MRATGAGATLQMPPGGALATHDAYLVSHAAVLSFAMRLAPRKLWALPALPREEGLCLEKGLVPNMNAFIAGYLSCSVDTEQLENEIPERILDYA